MAQRLTLGRGGEEEPGVSVLIDEARAALTSRQYLRWLHPTSRRRAGESFL
jgi:hypothetical protein